MYNQEDTTDLPRSKTPNVNEGAVFNCVVETGLGMKDRQENRGLFRSEREKVGLSGSVYETTVKTSLYL